MASIRPLWANDTSDLARFVLMAAFPPWRPPSEEELSSPHVRRWLDAWKSEIGVGWEDRGILLGAAWAREVEPQIVREASGQPLLPEVIIAVTEQARGRGIGSALMRALMSQAATRRVPGLRLSVGDQNEVAVRLYERLGFVREPGGAVGQLIMTWVPNAEELSPSRLL